MPMQHSMETAEWAEQLYCWDGHTLSEVAMLTGVSLRSLKRWSHTHGWKAKRLETRRALMGIRTKTMLLREKLIERCVNSQSPADIYAFAAIETLARRAGLDAPKKSAGPLLKLRAKTQGEENAAAALEKAYLLRMSQLLDDPVQLSSATVRGLKEAMALVRVLKNKLGHFEKNGRRPGLSDEAANEIRRKILGISDENWTPRGRMLGEGIGKTDRETPVTGQDGPFSDRGST
jgi:hypothetical protein